MRIGDQVVVQLGEREVLGHVSRVTPVGVEITFKISLPPAVLGTEPGRLIWSDGREELISPGRSAITATVVLPVEGAPSDLERRTSIRLRRCIAVDVALDRPSGLLHLATGATRDLSSEGARLRLDRGLKVGERVQVTLHLDDETLVLPASVARHRRLDDLGHDVGLRFDHPNSETKARLARFIFAKLRSARSTRQPTATDQVSGSRPTKP